MNFILRRFNKEGNPMNTILGRDYQLIKRNDQTHDQWKKTLQKYYLDIRDEYVDKVVVVILTDDSILIDAPCYIMTENGTTFEKI
jgi:galactose-1-phosphate uridylyltransferase